MSLGFKGGWKVLLATMGLSVASVLGQTAGIVSSEFIAPTPPSVTSHSSTIVEVNGELLAAWMGGSTNRGLDANIWFARKKGGAWSAPVEIANGIHDEDRVRNACWNPVLFLPRSGPLYLFYKEGRSPETWWGMVMVSNDSGKTWSPGKKLPIGFLGPVRNKPIEVEGGWILCPSSIESSGWLTHIERTQNPLKAWYKTGPLNTSMAFGAIQPTFLRFQDGSLEILCRTKQGKVVSSWSRDNGVTWSAMKATGLPNPNSAIDAVTLRDGRSLLVYNHSATDRGLLNVAMTKDGKIWEAALTLENEPGAEYSYPAVIQTDDGKVHVTYSANRQKIKHVVLDPEQFQLKPMVDGEWPK